MNSARTLILRLRHDSPTKEAAMEAADLIEQLSRAQRRLPNSGSVELAGTRVPRRASSSFLLLPLDGEGLR